MGTFISYHVIANRINNHIVNYELIIFDEHCLNSVNTSLNQCFILEESYDITIDTLEKIRSILGNYTGSWSL